MVVTNSRNCTFIIGRGTPKNAYSTLCRVRKGTPVREEAARA
jgi:hypothetical protein